MKLFPHQEQTLERLAAYKGGGYGVWYAPGGGKSRTTIEYVQGVGFKKTLIVSPAFVRKTWEREFKLWGRKQSNIKLLSSGKDVEEAKDAAIVVTSYELLKHIDWKFDCVVFDEGHYLSQEKSLRSGHARRVANLSEETLVLSLTGTPVPKEPKDLWNLLDTMNPRMFGSYWSFVRRYCKEVENPYTPSGKMWVGLREDRAGELMRRLDTVSHRVSFDEFAAHVPRMRIQPLYVKGPKLKKGLDWDDPDSWESLLAMNSSNKIDAVVEKTDEAVNGGLKKLCWGVWLHSTAEQLAARIKALGIDTYVVNGLTPSDERQAVLDVWADNPRPAVVIVGIAAIKEGVNELVHAQVAGCVEIPWRPSDLDQYMKRFERLNSQHSVLFHFFIAEGSRDERAANAYLTRKADINQIIKPGQDDLAAVETLGRVQSNEEILAGLFT